MNKCKQHEYCKFKGKGKHLGCKWHGIVDACTSDMKPEYQKLFDDGYLVVSNPEYRTEDNKEDNKQDNKYCYHYSESKNSGWGFVAFLIVVAILIYTVIH